MVVYDLATPYFISPLDVLNLCQTCKYLNKNENNYYHLYLIMLREVVNEHFVELFHEQRLISYEYMEPHNELVQFLNYNKNARKYSWKTCFMLFFLNFSIYPKKEYPCTKLICKNNSISLLLPISVLKTKCSQYTKNYLKYHNTVVMYKNKLNNIYREYIRKVEHVNILTNELPFALKNIQKEFSENITVSETKGKIQQMCRKIVSNHSTVRNIQNEMDIHVKTLERRVKNERYAEEKLNYFDKVVNNLIMYHNFYVYNIMKDNNK